MFRLELQAAFAPYAALSETQLSLLEEHYQLLTHWNKKINLTRIQTLDEAVKFHYCESLFVGHVLPKGTWGVADVGSGGGFPGIPFAILRPECTVHLIESHQRKAVFLREASRRLPNVEVSSSRAASASGDWDWVIARAVRPQDVLALRIAPNVALLMSRADLQGLPEPQQIFQVPWGEQRVVTMFHVKLDSQRST
jgi:16S rRNA (guanine(527)-N(7))-methyltransferase RsmG